MRWEKILTKWNDDNIYDVTDPVQGDAANCAFIAALSSLAWIQKGLIEQQTNEPTTISFYKEDGTTDQVTVDWKLCYQIDTDNLVYAHSSQAEIWPAIYEKAYGSWRSGATIISCDGYIGVDWGGNPCTALTHLTNKASTTKLTVNKTPQQITTDIRYKCYSNGKTKYPMVAWTYPTAPPGVTYDDEISAAHSYSLLGWYKDNSGKYHIVLRNPIGNIRQANTETWIISIGAGDGIFKVAEADFQQKFEAYGYVVL